MPYTVSEEVDDLEGHAVALYMRDAHGVDGGAAALGGTAGIEDLKAVIRAFVQGKMRVTEHNRIHALAETTPQPLEAPPARPRVVDQGDASAAGLDDPLAREHAPQLGGIHVAVNPRDGGPDRLELAQHRKGHEVAGVQEQIGGGDPLDAGIGEPPRAAWEVSVGDDGDEHSRLVRLVPGCQRCRGAA